MWFLRHEFWRDARRKNVIDSVIFCWIALSKLPVLLTLRAGRIPMVGMAR